MDFQIDKHTKSIIDTAHFSTDMIIKNLEEDLLDDHQQ